MSALTLLPPPPALPPIGHVETRLRATLERQARELGQQDALILQLRQQLRAAKEDVAELRAMLDRALT